MNKNMLIICGSLCFSIPVFAETTYSAIDCTKAASAVEKTICGDTEILELDKTLIDALNHPKIEFLPVQDEDPIYGMSAKAEWMAKRDQCSEAETQDCVKDMYLLRLEELDPTVPKFSIVDDANGVKTANIEYEGKYSENMVNLSIDQKILETGSYGSEYLNDYYKRISELNSWQADLSQTGAGSHNNVSRYVSLKFEDEKLLCLSDSTEIIYSTMLHPSSISIFAIYDKTSEAKIPFAELFDPKADMAQIEKLITKELIVEITAQSKEQQAFEGGNSADLEAYFAGLEEQFKDRKIIDWKDSGLSGEKGQKISKFVMNSVYSPYVSPQNENDIEIDVTPFLPFIKPEYRDSFVK